MQEAPDSRPYGLAECAEHSVGNASFYLPSSYILSAEENDTVAATSPSGICAIRVTPNFLRIPWPGYVRKVASDFAEKMGATQISVAGQTCFFWILDAEGEDRIFHTYIVPYWSIVFIATLSFQRTEKQNQEVVKAVELLTALVPSFRDKSAPESYIPK